MVVITFESFLFQKVKSQERIENHKTEIDIYTTRNHRATEARKTIRPVKLLCVQFTLNMESPNKHTDRKVLLQIATSLR